MAESANPKPKRNYFLRRGWKDFLFLIALAGMSYKGYQIIHPSGSSTADDLDYWKNRPSLNLSNVSVASAPCFFLKLSTASAGPESGAVADCLSLIPNGIVYDLVEVDLSQGNVIPVKTDLSVADLMPLAFTRTYWPVDDWFKHNGSYIPHVYDPYLTGSRLPYTYIDWTLPDHRNVHFPRVSAGTGYADSVCQADSAAPAAFAGAKIGWDGWGWALALPDGTAYLSPEAYNATRPQQGSLSGIFDKDGNEIRFSRAENGDLRQVETPSGKFIRLSYTDGKLTGLEDSSGNRVSYAYDSQSRPATVTYSRAESVVYAYDDANFLTAIESPPGNQILAVSYDARHNVTGLALAGGKNYSIRYGEVFQNIFQSAEVTAPDGSATRVSIQPRSYSAGKMSAGASSPHP
ncbi:MAG TPA: hypothetical protein VFO34_11250 [Candidatus Acidoferrales bacterium]|nr:hypothetical protein [Candidatus Acidoferrales bacterium]